MSWVVTERAETWHFDFDFSVWVVWFHYVFAIFTKKDFNFILRWVSYRVISTPP
jgi:hypothetical protein